MARCSNAFQKILLLSIACVTARTLALPILLIECEGPVTGSTQGTGARDTAFGGQHAVSSQQGACAWSREDHDASGCDREAKGCATHAAVRRRQPINMLGVEPVKVISQGKLRRTALAVAIVTCGVVPVAQAAGAVSAADLAN